jgi:TetR/AcrR family transcriptional regulator
MNSKEKIISTALEVFAEKGKHGTRMEEIAVRAKVNKAMIYYYFRDKDNLYREVLRVILRKIYEYIISKVKGKTDNEDIVKIVDCFVRAHFGAFSQNIKFPKIIFEALTDEPEEIAKVMEDVKGEFNISGPMLLMGAMEKGISKRILRKINVHQILISLMGMNLIHFIGKPVGKVLFGIDVKDEDKFLRERENSIVDLLMNGILERKVV